MSFSENVKNEISSRSIKLTCCRKAFIFGLLINSEPSEDGSIIFETEHEGVFESAFGAVKEQFHKEPAITERSRMGHIRKGIIIKSNSCASLLSSLEESESFSDALGFRCDSCSVSFLCGAFLACATVSDPVRSYHLEFTVKNAKRAKLLFEELSAIGLRPKIADRKNGVGLYFKDSEAIEEILTYLGASKMLFECMNDKILRELRNDTNRRANCETGNIAKSVSAAQELISVINSLREAGLLAALPDDLRETAEVRVEHPEASLSELCLLFSPPLSKSGLNHRLIKIKKFAEDIDIS